MFMGGMTYTNPVEPKADRQRKAVEDYFHGRSIYWRDVYDADTLSAFIYRERRKAVLEMVDKLELPECSRILEVGCGAGLTTVALAKKGYRVNAVDRVQDMLELTRQAARDAEIYDSVGINLGDIYRISFPPRYFGLVLAVGVLPWLQYPERALLEMFRVAKPGGYVILATDNSWSLNLVLDPLCFPAMRPIRWWAGRALERLGIWCPSRPRSHRHSITEVDEFLAHAGLNKLEGKTLGFGPFTFFKQRLLPDKAGIRVHLKLQNVADRKFWGIRSLGTEHIVVARKPLAD